MYRDHHSAFIPFIDRISTRQSLKNYEKRMIARSLAVTSLQSFSCTDEKLRSCVLQFTNFESVQSVGGQASFNPKSYKYERIFEVGELSGIRDETVPPSLSHWSSLFGRVVPTVCQLPVVFLTMDSRAVYLVVVISIYPFSKRIFRLF